ncbi:MAG: ATP-binding protein, partial [Myxococcota bacterium]
EALRRLDVLSYGLSHTLRPPLSEAEAVDVDAAAQAALEGARIRRRAEAAPPVEVELDVSGDGTVQLPRGLLAIVLDCVFDNALDAFESDGRGTLRVRNTSEGLDIENDGPMIATEIHHTLFEPFIGVAHHRRFRPGLGLSRARAAADRAQCSLTMDESTEQRTLFRLRPNPA